MPIIKVKVRIQNEEENKKEEVSAIIEDDKIKYKEKDNTTVIYDYKSQVLKRKNDKINMLYLFEKDKKTEGFIEIKGMNNKIKIEIKTIIIKRKNYDIEIQYEIENQKFQYQIEEIKWV